MEGAQSSYYGKLHPVRRTNQARIFFSKAVSYLRDLFCFIVSFKLPTVSDMNDGTQKNLQNSLGEAVAV